VSAPSAIISAVSAGVEHAATAITSLSYEVGSDFSFMDASANAPPAVNPQLPTVVVFFRSFAPFC
jgi:hypothetical protein